MCPGLKSHHCRTWSDLQVRSDQPIGRERHTCDVGGLLVSGSGEFTRINVIIIIMFVLTLPVTVGQEAREAADPKEGEGGVTPLDSTIVRR